MTKSQAQESIKERNIDAKINRNSKAVVYSTTKETNERITQTAILGFESHPQPLEVEECIFIDPSRQFQSIIGFGGALTDAAAETFFKLPKTAQDSILNAYYDS